MKEESRMDTDAESLPNCYAITWGNCPEQQIPLVAFNPTTLEEVSHSKGLPWSHIYDKIYYTRDYLL